MKGIKEELDCIEHTLNSIYGYLDDDYTIEDIFEEIGYLKSDVEYLYKEIKTYLDKHQEREEE